MKTMLGDTWTSAVFNLKVGGITRAIEVPRGFYVAKLESPVKEGRIQNLGEVRPVVIEAIKDEKVGPKFEEVGELMREIAEKHSGLQKLAEVTGTSVTETGKADKTATFLPGINNLGDFAEMVSDLQKGGRSEVLSDANRHLVIEIKEEFPEHLPELSEVREQAEKAFKDMKALEMARTAAETLKSKSGSLEQFEAAVIAMGTTTTKSRPFTRKDVATVLGPISNFIRDTASVRKGDIVLSVLGTKTAPTGYAVWHLSQVTEPSKAEFARELFTITREVENEKRAVLMQDFFRMQEQALLPKTKFNPDFQ
jgi:hypothetical protein